MRTLIALMATAAALTLSGCSTPQVALDQANHGAALIAQLELSLAEFRRVERNAEQARRDSLEAQLGLLEELRASRNRDARARRSAGDTGTALQIERLMADSDAMGADDAAARAAYKANDAMLAALLAPLPSTRDASTAAQKKLAEMGAELSHSQRFEEFLSFAQAIKAAVKVNEAKIKEAEKAAK